MHFCLSVSCPAIPCSALHTVVQSECRLSFCSVLNRPPLWVLSAERKKHEQSLVLLPQLCFTWAECVFLQWGDQLADE